ncbi:MAG: hypothetical protein JNK61_12000 [Bacteroidia bacterium]|nr:hypothetical protein [Bacteroidia bacterium]HQV00508.1 hypothetical protein [Bacteroidia bacterium]
MRNGTPAQVVTQALFYEDLLHTGLQLPNEDNMHLTLMHYNGQQLLNVKGNSDKLNQILLSQYDKAAPGLLILTLNTAKQTFIFKLLKTQ